MNPKIYNIVARNGSNQENIQRLAKTLIRKLDKTKCKNNKYPKIGYNGMIKLYYIPSRIGN